MTKWFYLSFATEETWLGATVVAAESSTDAFDIACARKLNPGGEVTIIEIPWAQLTKKERVSLLSYEGRLVSRTELMDNGGYRMGDMNPDEREAIERASSIVCIGHNPLQN